MKYFFNHIIVIGFIFTIVGKINAQHLYYPKQNQTFVQYKWNNLTVQDSSTLLNFNLKFKNLDVGKNGKIRVVHIGDSHVQAGFFTNGLRKEFHEILGCGVKERGFVFPFAITQNTGPLNVVQKFEGEWKKVKTPNANLGINAIAVQSQDTAKLKLYFKNQNGYELDFDSVCVFGHWDTAFFNCWIKGNLDKNWHLSLPYHWIKLDILSDTLHLILEPKNTSDKNQNAQINGLYLGNNLNGITFSEIGLNGAKLSDFLSAPLLNKELKFLQPDLIIVSLGTNDLVKAKLDSLLFYNQYDSLLFKLKHANKLASIILTVPPDFKINRKYPVPDLLIARKIILSLAKKHNCAVWDLFSVMGGANSIQIWVDANLVANDKIHFKPKGYVLQGELLAQALINQYNEYVMPLKKKSIEINNGFLWQQKLKSIFLFQNGKPWTFTSWEFWMVFGFVYAIFAVFFDKNKLKIAYLWIFSLFFYYKSSEWYIGILIFSTFIDYFLGKRIYLANSKLIKKVYLGLSIIINLFLLGFFKYSYFIIEQLNFVLNTNFKAVNIFSWTINELFSSNLDISEIILPAGISFFTFQTMSYAIDIYNNKIKPTNNIVDFGFYVTFFPQLVAGPIIRAQEFIPQINQKFSLDKHQLAKAFFLIYSGLIKKIIISDYLAHNIVDAVFAQPLNYTGIENLLAIYAYAIQIYCDFSAYSDIAIALALLLGYQLPSNFNNPYTAKSITQFWNTWHQSLSRWLKDYVYIPLGGNRNGKIKQFFNLLFTMLIGGLWHGASLKFIFWGGFHGFALIVDKIIQKWSNNWKFKNYSVVKFVSIIFTFHLVSFAWIFFRANTFNDGIQLLYQIKNHFIPSAQFLTAFLFNYNWVIFWIGTVFIGQFLFDYIHDFILKILFKSSWWTLTIITAVIVFILFQFSSIPNQPFIYFYF